MDYLHLILFIIFIISVFSFLSIAPWVPTRNKDLERINELIKLKPWEKFLEIWCWTALVSIYIAKNNPNSDITWIELSPLFYIISKVKTKLSNQKNIKIILGNALKVDYSKYDVLYIFWMPDVLKNILFKKLKKELKTSWRLVSYCFKMENDYFNEQKNKPEGKNSVYIYSK